MLPGCSLRRCAQTLSPATHTLLIPALLAFRRYVTFHMCDTYSAYGGRTHCYVCPFCPCLQAGVVSPLMASARRMLWRLGAAAAREALDAALRPHSDWPLAQRLLSLKTALARAEAAIGAPLSALQGRSAEAAGAAEEKAAVGVATPADDEAQADGSFNRRVSSDAEAGAGPAPLPVAVTTNGAGAAGAAGAAKHTAGGGAASSADQGSSIATRPVAAAATAGIADAAATVTASHSSSASHVVAAPGRSSAAASDAQALEQSGAVSTAALAASDNAMHSGGLQAAADASAVAPMTPEDEAAVSALAELAGKAWRVVEEDERQAARLDAEKAAAEKARREQVERDKQERLKQEQVSGRGLHVMVWQCAEANALQVCALAGQLGCWLADAPVPTIYEACLSELDASQTLSFSGLLLLETLPHIWKSFFHLSL